MNDSGPYRDLNKAHEDARTAAQAAHDKAEALRQDKLRDHAAAAMEVAEAREISQRLGRAALKQEHDEAARKSAERTPPAAPAHAPQPRQPDKKVELQHSPVDRPAPAAAQSLPPRQPVQFFTLEGTVATRPARETEPSRPIDKRQEDYDRRQREAAHQDKLQAARSLKLNKIDPREHAKEELARQQKNERERADRERREARNPLVQTRVPAVQQPTSEQLRPDSRPATVRGPDTGRLSPGASREQPQEVAGKENTDRVARLKGDEDRRPKTDRDAWREAARANAAAERGNRGRDDDSGRDR